MSEDPIVRLNPKSVAGGRRPGGLGRGLDALLGERRADVPNGDAADGGAASGVTSLPIAQVSPHPDQPRRHFDNGALDELAASIAQHGLLQPIVVRPLASDCYQIVAGERRWRASQRAGLTHIPALVRDLADRDVTALALIENLQREDLNPIEEARAYRRLVDEDNFSQADIARLVDKSRSHVANLLRLLTLPDPVIAAVADGTLSMGHARALVGVANAERIARTAIEGQLSVRAVEKMTQRRSGDGGSGGANTPGSRRTVVDQDDDLTCVQQNLEALLSLPVRIVAGARPDSGAVTISYETIDQLDVICQRLSGRTI